jgi:hypothetical protein
MRWDHLKRLESRHRQLQREHDVARRRLDQVTPEEADELRNAWRDYCEVIAELDEATAALEHLRTNYRAGRGHGSACCKRACASCQGSATKRCGSSSRAGTRRRRRRSDEVHGMKRRASLFNTDRIDHLYEDPHASGVRLILHYGDLTDATNVMRVIQQVQPHEIYNLAAQSHVQVSFETPEYTANADGLGTLRILEAIRILRLEGQTRFYQASTSEMFGMVQETPQTEDASRARSELGWAPSGTFDDLVAEMVAADRCCWHPASPAAGTASTNPDLFAAQLDPYDHCLARGADEGRLPCDDPLSLLDRLLEEQASRSGPPNPSPAAR